jgi:DNA-binding IclR family transcriptional regulator
MSRVPAADQVLGILAYLSEQAGPTTAAAIERDVGLPRSTTYHLLNTLLDRGFVVHLAEEKRYALGIRAFELGSGYSRHVALQRLARGPMSALVDRTGHNAHLAVLHDTEVVYVIEERAPGGPTLVTDVDVRLPAHLTASGRAILADLADNHLRALFSRQGAFILRTENGPSSWAALCRILAESRSRGYATENEEVTEGFASIAVAVSDHTRHPVAAVAVTFPVALESEDLRAELVARVSRTAADLSRRVGGAALELPSRNQLAGRFGIARTAANLSPSRQPSGPVDFESAAHGGSDGLQVVLVGTDHQVMPAQGAFNHARVHDVACRGASGKRADRAGLAVIERFDVAPGQQP